MWVLVRNSKISWSSSTTSTVNTPRLGMVLEDTLTVGLAYIQLAEIELGACMALLGQRLPLTQGCCVVVALIGVHARLKIGQCGSSESDERQRRGDG